MTSNENYRDLWNLAKRLMSLKTENLKLTLTQKLTLFLGATAIAMTGLIIGALTIAFLSLALARYLSDIMPLYCGYLIVAGLLVLAFIIIFSIRRIIIFNPLARFISKLFFEN